MKAKICFCPASIAWIFDHLTKSARNKFRSMISPQIRKLSITDIVEFEKGRTARTNNPRDFDSLKDDPNLDLKAIENIRKELKTIRKKRRTAKQIRATKKLIAFNNRRRLRR